jgi:imidazolonepropionase-like amidohydrolase
MKKIAHYIVCNILILNMLNAQTIPTPAANQKDPILILNATAHIGNGDIIPNAAIAFENGKITMVADAAAIRLDMARYKKVVEAAGKHVYPGLIGMNTHLGLVEIEAVRQTVDYAEIGEMNPSVRSLIAYNTDSQLQPTIRSNGVLLAQVVPNGGILSGQSSVMALDGWNWEDAALRVDEGMHLRFPNVISTVFDFNTFSATQRKNENYIKQMQDLEAFFTEAKAYTEKVNPQPKNLKFEAMRGIFAKKQTLYIHAMMAKDITEGVLFGKKFGCKTVIVGGKDSWLVSDLLKENRVAVILNETQDLPSRPDDDIDQPFKTPAHLQKAGILFALSVNGAWQQRNLPLMAGQAVAFGLGYEEAIAAMTSNAAKILGIENSVGTLEQGKDATLFISEGDVLDMQTSKVSHAFIQVKEVDLDNKNKQLYRRFKTKYERR